MNKNIYRISFEIFKPTILVFLTLITLILLLRFHGYTLFHTAAEFFSILISFAIFIFAWSIRNIFQNNYLQYLSIGYLFVGILDGFHALTYKGMGIFTTFPADTTIHIWIIARFMEAGTFLVALYFAKNKNLKLNAVFALYLFITLASIALIYAALCRHFLAMTADLKTLKLF